MSSKIRVLDEHTINKIAAGEVIESPASVVKELIENSLDAGSTEICVEIQGGGRQLIRITDNGCGMNRDDALLCLERHATSKIKEVEDIQSILTMGFRGEAIPSIASISKFMLLTCPKDEAVNEGTMLIVDGGRILQCGPAARSPGTTIEIKSLFFNVPVRRKFQKSPAHDANEIMKVMTLLALCNPQIKFQFIDNQKNELQTKFLDGSFTEQLKERMGDVLGTEFIASCCPVDIETDAYKLQGYVGLPTIARLNRTGQYLFINNRAVSSPLVSFTVRDAYGTALPTNKHPVFVLHLTVPGEIMDVNVHPQKKEVRLRPEPQLKEMILKGVRQAIQKGSFEPHELFVQEEVSQPHFTEAISPTFVRPAFALHPNEELALRKEYDTFYKPQYVSEKPLEQKTLVKETIAPFFVDKPSFPKVLSVISSYIILDAATMAPWKAIPSDSLCLVDQKAAHSRVIFEKLLTKKSEGVGIQSLLLPVPLQLAPHEASLLKLHLESLNEIGIHIQEIGQHSFLINAIPTVFGNVDMIKLIKDLLENLKDFADVALVEKEMEKRLALSASYASVNHTRRLNVEEAQTLINRLFACETPFICPLGKSTLTFISNDELVKKFQKAPSCV